MYRDGSRRSVAAEDNIMVIHMGRTTVIVVPIDITVLATCYTRHSASSSSRHCWVLLVGWLLALLECSLDRLLSSCGLGLIDVVREDR